MRVLPLVDGEVKLMLRTGSGLCRLRSHTNNGFATVGRSCERTYECQKVTDTHLGTVPPGFEPCDYLSSVLT